MSNIKKIGILTSGGDAPGMNNAIKAIVNASLKNNIKPYFIYEGYKGLIDENIHEATSKEVKNISSNGGTFLYSARYPEFKNLEIRERAVEILKKHEIDALVTIGGDGTYQGAAKLSNLGIKTIALPGTIDNDISSTDFTIGYFTALQTIIDSIEKLRDTHESHNRVSIIEVMGRYCGDLAINAAIATGVEILSVPEHKLTEEEIISEVLNIKRSNQRSIIILVTEHLYEVQKLATVIEQKTSLETKPTILGHVQRGGKPIGFDRILGTLMGTYAVERLMTGETSVSINIKENNKLYTLDINETLKIERPSKKWLLEQYNLSK